MKILIRYCLLKKKRKKKSIDYEQMVAKEGINSVS